MRPETGQLDWDDLAARINGRTKACGDRRGLERARDDQRRRGPPRACTTTRRLVFVDAVHYAPHRLVDVRAWDCDFLACSAYKFYGPARRRPLRQATGGSSALDVPKLELAPDTSPERFETGTQNHEGIAGAAAAVDFLASLARGPTRGSGSRRPSTASTIDGPALVGAPLARGCSAMPAGSSSTAPPDRPRGPRRSSFAVRGRSGSREGSPGGSRAEDLFASHGTSSIARTLVERLGRVARLGSSVLHGLLHVTLDGN